ncbi:unnamed protein product [Cylicostephanus goldi]|uniref:Uncharacterized protein n=1 Tax=Cylicostephanus goldi TaxID=71465 RepID=A0A3P6T9N5_CYLGO|nr:unnamed protein product [Cylicostephanus goldi]
MVHKLRLNRLHPHHHRANRLLTSTTATWFTVTSPHSTTIRGEATHIGSVPND